MSEKASRGGERQKCKKTTVLPWVRGSWVVAVVLSCFIAQGPENGWKIVKQTQFGRAVAGYSSGKNIQT